MQTGSTTLPAAAMRSLFAAACLGLATMAAATAKAAPASGDAAVVQAISRCRGVTDDQARLACYDKASEAFDKARAEGQVVVVDREQVNAVRRQAFGLNLPTLSLLPHGPKFENLDKLTVKLANAYPGVDGKWVLVTVDKAVWRLTDNSSFVDDPHAGSTMLVRQGMLGSFFCKIDGQSAVRCTRDR